MTMGYRNNLIYITRFTEHTIVEVYGVDTNYYIEYPIQEILKYYKLHKVYNTPLYKVLNS